MVGADTTIPAEAAYLVTPRFPHLRSPLLRTLGAAVVGTAVVAALAWKAGAITALGLTVLAACALGFLIWPAVATFVVVFLLYVNFPAILTKQHGWPPAAAGAFILLLVFPLLHSFVVRRAPFKADRTFLLMLAYFVWLTLSSFGAVDFGIAGGRIADFLFEGLLLYWLLFNAIRSLSTLRQVIWTVLLAGSLLAGLSLYQNVTGNYDQEFGGLAYRHYIREVATKGGDLAADPEILARAARDRKRAQGPVNQANRFAQILVVLLPLAGYVYRTSQSARSRAAAATCALLIATGVLLTLSRGGFLTMAALVVMMVLMRWVPGGRLSIAAVVLVVAVVLLTPTIASRLESITDAGRLLGARQSQYEAVDGAMGQRLSLMRAAFLVFLDHPILGVGPGQYAPYYSQQYANTAEAKIGTVNRPMRAHSLYLELAAELGAVGLLLFVATVGSLVRALWRARRALRAHDQNLADLATAFCLCLAVFLFNGLSEHLEYQRYFWFLVVTAGVGLELIRSSVRTASREMAVQR